MWPAALVCCVSQDRVMLSLWCPWQEDCESGTRRCCVGETTRSKQRHGSDLLQQTHSFCLLFALSLH